MLDIEDNSGKKGSSWLSLLPPVIDSITRLLSTPAYIRKTTIIFTPEEFEWLVKRGYIKMNNGKPEMVDEKKIIELCKGDFKILKS